MGTYSILEFAFKSVVWIFLAFCLLSCFFSAYRHFLLYCFLPNRREQGSLTGAGELTLTRGLQESEIEVLPKFCYPPSDGVGMSREITECVVCLGVFKEGETLRLIPMCGHVFHADCVDVWFREHATCPCCRAYLDLPVTGPTTPATTDSPV